ncbi:3-deoxy-D-manno-octulosonic acid transferase [Thalassococcus lentus]|uniref:3-deoxy-D-manno-octulosonic acid transferase n=1 Tax=Thalassococcus lentus TaxID=1210524 RepID=A0ABT4XU84_9RHOB|nr:glycosyltransferase N-terminal domain-containing protein [Thalassococcus lentus]MDA7425457.1 3-deoxy-D-manno-octulosonic acid transferase [Thalassococcus lentus]
MLLYRILISLFAVIELFRAARREGWAGVQARLGLSEPELGPHIWLHGASNGELASARGVLEAMIAAQPDLRWLVTCNSASGLDVVRRWGFAEITVRPAPLDLSWVTKRMMRRWNVEAHISLESEIWPHRFAQCPGPVILLGARLSEGTAQTFGHVPTLAAATLAKVDLVIAQDSGSLARLRGLGLPERAEATVANLKTFYKAPEADLPDASLTSAFDRANTWLAASTHEGEEGIILNAHQIARGQLPDLKLILAPRHPNRIEAIEALVERAGFSYARRSNRESPEGVDVYLADTFGEMHKWYALSGRVFIGGSLVAKGGHTPYEPAAFECALMYGMDMRNFASPALALAAARVSNEVEDADTLAAALIRLKERDDQQTLARAQATLLKPEMDMDALLDCILKVLPGA